jgi:aminoacrylate hydrolase
MPRVLIVPGLNGHPEFLLRTAPRLFPGWQAVGFDHRFDLAEDGVEGLARRALAVLEASGEAPAIVCGESFGGTVALTLARRWPERVRGLILFSAFGWYPSGVARRASPMLPVWSFLGRRLNQPAFRATTRLVALPGQLGLRFTREIFQEYIYRAPAHAPAYRRKLELALEFDARPWLATLDMPTFVLVGSWDPIVPTSAGRLLARSIPGAELHQLPGGHLVHAVRPTRVAELLSAWAKTHGLA